MRFQYFKALRSSFKVPTSAMANEVDRNAVVQLAK